MPFRLSRAATQAAYGISQLPRLAWYIGHSFLLRELADATREREEPKAKRRAHSNSPVPDRKRIYADMAQVFFQDLANVEAGIYPIPADHDGSLFASTQCEVMARGVVGGEIHDRAEQNLQGKLWSCRLRALADYSGEIATG